MYNNIVKIIRQANALEKGICIIKSCTTADHFEVAIRYSNRYHAMFNDYKGYTDLIRLIQRTRLDSLTP